MQVVKIEWIVGGSTSDVSEAIEVTGGSHASIQVVGDLSAAAYLQGSVDGTWENLGRAQVDSGGPSQILAIDLPPVQFLRVAVADDAGGLVTVGAIISS